VKQSKDVLELSVACARWIETAAPDNVNRVIAKPMFFGPLGRRLFGWLHLPVTASRSRVGAVLCPPLGQESINVHRSMRFICNALAGAGIPALRIDYDGCGNSAGDDHDPDRLAAWVDSIRAAIAATQRDAQVDRVILVGVRFGAMLAMLAAAGRNDLAGIVTIAPVTNGRALVREWKAMKLVGGWRRRDPSAESVAEAGQVGDGSIEAAGFVMTAQTCESVGKVNLLEVGNLSCPLLVIDRNDVGGSERWVEKLSAAGVTVERVALPGYLAMMRDPAYSQVPTEAVDALVAWAVSRSQAYPGAATQTSPSDDPVGSSDSAVFAPTADRSSAVVERIWLREDDGAQFAVLSEPLNTQGGAEVAAPVLMLVNSGAVHHVGPNRLYVRLARHFAALGFRVLRVDLSGLGDSQPHAGEPEVSPYTSRGVRDIDHWMAFLRAQRPIGEAHLLGICSGGFQAFRSALEGLPFATVMSLNPVNFYWKDGMQLDVPIHEAHHEVVRLVAGYRRSLLEPAKWRKLFAGEVDVKLAARVAVKRVSARMRLQARGVARVLGVRLKNDLASDLFVATGRSTALEFMFSRGDPGRRILYEQAGSTVDRLRAARKLVVTEVPGADHTFSSEASRCALTAMLTDRLVGPRAPFASCA